MEQKAVKGTDAHFNPRSLPCRSRGALVPEPFARPMPMEPARVGVPLAR